MTAKFRVEFTRAGAACSLLCDILMETLIDPFELLAPGSVPVPAMRPRMQSIVIDVEWDDSPPPSSPGHRIWMTED